MFIGVDIGTRNIKFGLYDETFVPVASLTSLTPWRIADGVRRLDPTRLLQVVMKGVEGVSEDRAKRVEGVGIASMAEVGFIEGPGGGAPRPSPAWFEDTGTRSASLLLDHFGDRFATMTGRLPSPVCTVAKVHDMWQSDGSPPRGRFHSVAEWVAYRLGGDPVAEASLASRTGLLDIRLGVASDEVMSWCELRRDFLPEVRNATDGVGSVVGVHPRIDGAALAVAGHDHLAAMVGVGATDVAEVLDSCGTAEAIVMNAEASLLDNALDLARAGGTVSRHVLDGRSAAFAPSFRSGAVLQRVLDALAIDVNDRAALAALDEEAERHVGSGPEMAIGGLLADPIEWPDALREASPARLWAAAIETIAANGVRRLEVLESIVDPADRVHVTGGWSQGPAVRRIKQQMSREVRFPQFPEAGARGAAIVAGAVARQTPLASGYEVPTR